MKKFQGPVDNDFQKSFEHCLQNSLSEFYTGRPDSDEFLCHLLACGICLYGEDLRVWPFEREILVAITEFSAHERITMKKDSGSFGIRFVLIIDNVLALIDSHQDGEPLLKWAQENDSSENYIDCGFITKWLHRAERFNPSQAEAFHNRYKLKLRVAAERKTAAALEDQTVAA